MEMSDQLNAQQGYPLPQDCRRERVVRKTNLSGVCALARQLMAKELARIRGKRPSNAPPSALDQEAREWVERQKEQA